MNDLGVIIPFYSMYLGALKLQNVLRKPTVERLTG